MSDEATSAMQTAFLHLVEERRVNPTRALSVAITNLTTAILWRQHDLASRELPKSEEGT